MRSRIWYNLSMRGFLKKVACFIIALVLAVLPGVPGFALSARKLDEFAQNNILFYDPDEDARLCAPGSYVSGPIAISGSDATEKIWSGLTSFLTPEQAAGVMGNMQSESNFNPAQHEVGLMNRHQPGFILNSPANDGISYGLGLIQWSFSRRRRMYDYVVGADSSLKVYLDDYQTYSDGYRDGTYFINKAGSDVFDRLVSLELQFLKDELNTVDQYRGVLNTTTVAEASEYFLRYVEVPGDMSEDVVNLRGRQAQAFYDLYSGNPGGGGGSSSGCSTNLEGLAGHIRGYAWPEYHNAPYLDRMPDYADAVARRASQGKYVGGTVGGVPGIDCGGFITTLIQESGYDPNYNSCASNVGPQEYYVREGAGSAYWEWLNPDGRAMNAADLQLGDVAMTGGYTGGCVAGGGHTWMWIGDFEGFETDVVSASYSTDGNGRAPMSGTEGANYNSPRWYRKVR